MQILKPLLLVDDDYLDVAITKRALRELEIANPMVQKTNGEDALEYLTTECSDSPCAVLLDLNIPKMNGLELLESIKEQEGLRHIPILILTTSPRAEDIQSSIELGAVAYVIKADNPREFAEALQIVERYCGADPVCEPADAASI